MGHARPGSGLPSRDLEKAGKPDKCLARDYIRALRRPEVLQGVWSPSGLDNWSARASHSEDSHRFLGTGHNRESGPEGPWLLRSQRLPAEATFLALVPLVPREAVLGQAPSWG